MSFLYQSAASLNSSGISMPRQCSRMGAVWNGRAAASGSDAKVGKGNAEVGKFREMQCPECEYGHWCTKVSPGVQITPGGLSRYREKC